MSTETKDIRYITAQEMDHKTSKMRVIWVVLSVSFIPSGKTQPTSIDLDHCQDNPVLRGIARKLELLAQQNKIFSISLNTFEIDGQKYATMIQDRLTELEKHHVRAIQTSAIAETEEKRISSLESVIDSQVSKLQSSVIDVVLNTSSSIHLQLESMAATQQTRATERHASLTAELSEALNASLTTWATGSFEKKLSDVNQLLVARQRLEIRYDENFNRMATGLANLTEQTNEDLLDQLSMMAQDMLTAIANKVQGVSTDGNVTIADDILHLVSLFLKQQNADIINLLPNVWIPQKELNKAQDIKDIIQLKMDKFYDQLENILNATTSGEFCPRDLIMSMVEHSAYIQQGTIRLVNGSHPTNGRVEIYFQRSWGTVCGDYWEDYEAYVVCRQLGFCDGLTSHEGYYGRAREHDPIYIGEVSCHGDEASLLACHHVKDPNCKQTNVGVSCLPCP